MTALNRRRLILGYIALFTAGTTAVAALHAWTGAQNWQYVVGFTIVLATLTAAAQGVGVWATQCKRQP